MLTYTLQNLEDAAQRGDVDEFSDAERSLLRWIARNRTHRDASEARRRYIAAGRALLRCCYDRQTATAEAY